MIFGIFQLGESEAILHLTDGGLTAKIDVRDFNSGIL
jgi:hypothetical protein